MCRYAVGGADELLGPWDIVGGHVQPGETAEEALAREIREETGWELRRILAQIADWEWEHDGVVRRELDFVVEVDGDLAAPRLEHGKHDAYAWVGADNLDLMMEGRVDRDYTLRDIVARAMRFDSRVWDATATFQRTHRVTSTRTAMRWLRNAHRWVYRVSRGRILGRLVSLPVLLLTTVGRKSGTARTTPLTYLPHGRAFVIVASNGGRPRHPAWFLNLQATRHAEVMVGPRHFRVAAREAAGEERARLWAEIVQRWGGYAGYERRTTRRIPVVVLEPVP